VIGNDVVTSQDLPGIARKLWLRPGEEVTLQVFAPGSGNPRRVVLRAQ
jgi:hypothetical protein